MSVLDEFRDAEQRVIHRLQELGPAVAEYHELQQIADRLGLSVDAPPQAGSGRRRAKRSGGKARTGDASRTSRRRPAPGSSGRTNGRRSDRREQVLALVRERPGITVRQAGTELGVDPTSLYRVVHQLERDNALEKRGRELIPIAAVSD